MCLHVSDILAEIHVKYKYTNFEYTVQNTFWSLYYNNLGYHCACAIVHTIKNAKINTFMYYGIISVLNQRHINRCYEHIKKNQSDNINISINDVIFNL